LSEARPSDGTLTDPDDIARLQEGIAALQSGERERARDIFADLVQRAYRDANTWLGLAMSSDDVHEAYGALRNARLIQPANPFVERAAADLARRWPEEAQREAAMLAEPPIVGPVLPAGLPGGVEEAPAPAAGAAAEAPAPVETDETAGGARLATGSRRAAETASPSRLGWRVLTTVVLGAGFLALVALLIFGLQNAEIFQPVRPTATATPPPTLAPPRTPQAPPTVAARTAVPAAGTGTSIVLPTLTPSGAAAARQRAIEAVQAGRFAQAVPLLEQATARDPQDAEALYYLGLAYLNAGDAVNGPGDALRAFRSVTALRPEWAPGLQMLAETLMRQRPPQYREAVPLARQAAQQDPARAEYWITLARAYEGAGDQASATTAYNEAARHSPAPPPLLPTLPATPATPTAATAPASPTAAPSLPTTPPDAGATPGAMGTATPAESPATPAGETPTP
jgi:tetratricopeptide (TPR) repeat protein